MASTFARAAEQSVMPGAVHVPSLEALQANDRLRAARFADDDLYQSIPAAASRVPVVVRASHVRPSDALSASATKHTQPSFSVASNLRQVMPFQTSV